jgi:hypothetical protein
MEVDRSLRKVTEGNGVRNRWNGTASSTAAGKHVEKTAEISSTS